MTTVADQPLFVPIFEPLGEQVIGMAKIENRPELGGVGFEYTIFTVYETILEEFWGPLYFRPKYEEVDAGDFEIQTRIVAITTSPRRENWQYNFGFNRWEKHGEVKSFRADLIEKLGYSKDKFGQHKTLKELNAELDEKMLEFFRKMSTVFKAEIENKIDDMFREMMNGYLDEPREKPVPAGFVDVDYIMNPETEYIQLGSELKEGDVVLIEDRLMRERLELPSDRDNLYLRARRRETSRWCRVTKLRREGNILKFEGVYSDGTHVTRTYNTDYTWYVKK